MINLGFTFDESFIIDKKISKKIIEYTIDNKYRIRKFLQKDIIVYFYCENLNDLVDVDTECFIIFKNIKFKNNNNYVSISKNIKEYFVYEHNTFTWNYETTFVDMLEQFYIILHNSNERLKLLSIKESDILINNLIYYFNKNEWNIILNNKDSRALKIKSLEDNE